MNHNDAILLIGHGSRDPEAIADELWAGYVP